MKIATSLGIGVGLLFVGQVLALYVSLLAFPLDPVKGVTFGGQASFCIGALLMMAGSVFLIMTPWLVKQPGSWLSKAARGILYWVASLGLLFVINFLITILMFASMRGHFTD